MSDKPRKYAKKTFKELDPRVRFIIIPVIALIAAGAIIFAIITIVNIPKPEGAQRGVGANGFRAYEEKDGNLGIASVTTRDAVAKALDAKGR